MKYYYVVYDGEYAIYDDIKLTVEYKERILRLKSIIVPYDGAYINSRGVCFIFITHNLNIYLCDDEFKYMKYKLYDFPDRIHCSYYQCIITIGHTNICYNSHDTIKCTIRLPEEPYVVSSNHIMYVKNGLLSSIPLRDSEVYMPMNVSCPYDIKRLYPYNMGCIIRTMDDKYYISPFDGYIKHVHILSNTFTTTNSYTRVNALDGMDIIDIGYYKNLYIRNSTHTYYDNIIINGQYCIVPYNNIFRLHPLNIPDRRNKSWNGFVGFDDILIECID